jgi:hypothetical protein
MPSECIQVLVSVISFELATINVGANLNGNAVVLLKRFLILLVFLPAVAD